MESVYDWVTIAMFAGLIVLYLQRSQGDERHDPLWHYLAAGAGCAAADVAGNRGQPIIAVALILLTIGYIFFVLKPFSTR